MGHGRRERRTWPGLTTKKAMAIQEAALEVAAGDHDAQFPIDVFQTGSGTSSNMNANEVIATLATGKLGNEVHPNDHVNMSQSSNDVIPTCVHVSAAVAIHSRAVAGARSTCPRCSRRKPAKPTTSSRPAGPT